MDPDPVDRARQICLNQLEFAPRTRSELAATLGKKGVEDDVADQVLRRFTEVGMIDDALFAQMWVGSRQRSKGLASRALRQELRRKGVDDESIAGAIATIEPAVELAAARTLVDRKLPSTRGLAPQVRIRRLAGMLARKGYPAGTAFRVVREALGAEAQTAGTQTAGPQTAGPQTASPQTASEDIDALFAEEHALDEQG